MQTHELSRGHHPAAPQDNAHRTLEPSTLPDAYLHKLHKSIFIYLQTITVYCINCQKHVTFHFLVFLCFFFFKVTKTK